MPGRRADITACRRCRHRHEHRQAGRDRRSVSGVVPLDFAPCAGKMLLPLRYLCAGQAVRGWPLVTVAIRVGVFEPDMETARSQRTHGLPRCRSAIAEAHDGTRLTTQQVGRSDLPAIAADPDARILAVGDHNCRGRSGASFARGHRQPAKRREVHGAADHRDRDLGLPAGPDRHGSGQGGEVAEASGQPGFSPRIRLARGPDALQPFQAVCRPDAAVRMSEHCIYGFRLISIGCRQHRPGSAHCLAYRPGDSRPGPGLPVDRPQQGTLQGALGCDGRPIAAALP